MPTTQNILTATFILSHPDAMIHFGQIIAKIFLKEPDLQYILLYGDIGCGKTTFARGFVQQFPKGELADISSPSFTICNHYPTEPIIVHCDLYRFTNTSSYDISDILDNPSGLLLIEWAEYLPNALLPSKYLKLLFTICDQTHRKVTCAYHGSKEKHLVHTLLHNQSTIQEQLTSHTLNGYK